MDKNFGFFSFVVKILRCSKILQSTFCRLYWKVYFIIVQVELDSSRSAKIQLNLNNYKIYFPIQSIKSHFPASIKKG